MSGASDGSQLDRAEWCISDGWLSIGPCGDGCVSILCVVWFGGGKVAFCVSLLSSSCKFIGLSIYALSCYLAWSFLDRFNLYGFRHYG